jgi:tetratricopeptide (TPR) repeat protein
MTRLASGTMGTRWAQWLVGAALLLLVWLVYLPGLSGGFLFDDFSNLSRLGEFGAIDSWWKALAWITSGFSGPTGRPVALASFLLDARDWPADPAAFKQTNLLIHLLTAGVLAGLITRIARALGQNAGRALWVGILSAAIWALHPLFVSTTLYVVQRMAMLSALFVLAGLWAYVHGRSLLLSGRHKAGYAWMSGGLLLGTLLATLSKENGALLALLAWVIEAFVFDVDGRARELGRGFLRWRRWFVVFPSLVLLGYLATRLPMVFVAADAPGRDFSVYERLLTEFRILWDYLGRLWLPSGQASGLFHDDITVSSGWLHPASTLLSALGLAMLVAFSLVARAFARGALARSVALALMFFLAGHLMESTWIPLELYFEHRNYLPAALMFLPLALFLARWAEHGMAGRVAVGMLVIVLAFSTAQRADLWGEPFGQALAWLRASPDSPRALAYMAEHWERTGNPYEAARLLDHGLERHPDNLLLQVARARLVCRADGAVGPRPAAESRLVAIVTGGDLGRTVSRHQVDQLLIELLEGCTAYAPDLGPRLIEAAVTNPDIHGNIDARRALLHRAALFALQQGNAARAAGIMRDALRLEAPPPGTRLLFAAELGSAGYPALGLDLLDRVPRPAVGANGFDMPSLRQRIIHRSGFYATSEEELRATLRQETASEREKASSSSARPRMGPTTYHGQGRPPIGRELMASFS